MGRAIRTRRGPRGSGGTTIGTIDDRDEERHDGWIESHTGQSTQQSQTSELSLFQKYKHRHALRAKTTTMKKARPAGITLPPANNRARAR
jgi:hypothetical protein